MTRVRKAALSALLVSALIIDPVAGWTQAARKPAATSSRPRSGASTRARAAKPAIDRTHPPAPGPAAALHLPQVTTEPLPNGLAIDVIEMHEAPIVDVTLTIPAGAVRDPDGQPGLATFTANMLDEGAGQRGALEIAEQVDFLGATLTTTAAFERAQIHLHVPRRQLPAALDLMADIALRPTFPDSEVARQRELRRTSILQLRDQPTQIAPLAFNAILFGAGHPYGRPSGGTEASTAALTRDQVSRFYATYYHPNESQILVVGDITPAEARSLIAARFGEWSRTDSPPLPMAVAPSRSARVIYLIDKPGAAQSVIRIGNAGVARSTPDYFTIQVLNTMLGGAFTSRLQQNLRETHGYTYSASSAFEMRRLPGAFRATASVVTAKTDSSLIEFLRELRRIRDEPVSAAELAKAKAYISLGLPSQFEATADAAAEFLDLIENHLPLNSYESYIDHIQEVTAEDVQRVARATINPDRLAIVVVGDRSQIEAGLRALNEGSIELRDLWGQPVH